MNHGSEDRFGKKDGTFGTGGCRSCEFPSEGFVLFIYIFSVELLTHTFLSFLELSKPFIHIQREITNQVAREIWISLNGGKTNYLLTSKIKVLSECQYCIEQIHNI